MSEKTLYRKRYMPPILIQQMEICLEGNLLTGSVVDKVQPVQTVGQKTDGIYDAADTDPVTATFNYEWGDSSL